MAKIKTILLGLLWLIYVPGIAQQNSLREKVKFVYDSQIGVRESTGNNDGEAVEAYLRYTGLTKGYAWCAAFVCWSLNQAGVENPRSAWSPNLHPAKKVIYKPSTGKKGIPQTGDVFGIYFPNLKRIAHVGFIDTWGSTYCTTVEGNTNDAGSREGDGVYRKRRLIKQIYSVSSYIQ